MHKSSQSVSANYCIVLILILHLAFSLLNSWRHNYRVGYDIDAHLAYAKVLSAGRMPTSSDTPEFFNPPLSYIPISFLLAIGFAEESALKATQLLQAFCGTAALGVLAIGLDRKVKSFALAVGCVISSSAWWRSFAMLRPESLVVLLILLGTILTAPLLVREKRIRAYVVAAAIWGCACLTRQWAIPVAISIFLLLVWNARHSRRRLAGLVIAVICFFFITAPFYLMQFKRYGSIFAFNREPSSSTLDWSWNPRDASNTPIRPHLTGHPIDILFADFFGDYWCYYLVWGKQIDGSVVQGSKLSRAIEHHSPDVATNLDEILPTLRSSAKAGLGIVVVVIAGVAVAIIAGTRQRPMKKFCEAVPILWAVVSVAMISGYLWFVGRYSTDSNTDTAKATYVIAAWPLLCGLAGFGIESISRRSPLVWLFVMAAVVVINSFSCTTWLSRSIINN